ncbi:MAG: hypothetical protein ACMZ7B_11030 [Balneola sp.]
MYTFIDKNNYTPTQGETSDQESLTVQGETNSIRDLMARYNSGMPLEQATTHYFDEEDVSKISRFRKPGLDLTDLDALQQQVEEMNQAVKNAQQRQQEEQQRKLEEQQRKLEEQQRKQEEQVVSE